MHNHAWCFVNDEKIDIFIHDIQGQFARYDIFDGRGGYKIQDMHLIGKSQSIPRLAGGFHINQDRPVCNKLLNCRAREFLYLRGKKTVEAYTDIFILYRPCFGSLLL